MDLPPRFRRHLTTYGNVLHPPHFTHHHHTLPPPPPPPPLPPHILLPPLLPPRHDAQLPLPSHFSFSPRDRIIHGRSYFQESDPSRESFLDHYHPPLTAPPHQDIITFRIIHDYPRQNSILENEIFRRGCSSSYAYDLPRTLDRTLHWDATVVNSRISDIKHRERYFSSRISGIESRDLWKDMNDDYKGWDHGINGSRELYFEREDDVRRWDCNINGGRDLCFERNDDPRRWESGPSGGRELYVDRDDDEARLDYGINDGISLQLESRRQEFLESNLGLNRFCGRLGRKSGKREFHRPRKMKRVRKKSVLYRIQSGKWCRRRIRRQNILRNLSSSSFKGKEKENFECLETITSDNQEREQSPEALSISFKSNSLVAKAILLPSNPVFKEDQCLSTRNKKIRKTNCMVNVGSANCSKDLVVTEHMSRFQSGLLCPQIELLEKFNISGIGNVAVHKADNLSDNFVGNKASKDMHSHDLNNVGSGRRLGRRSKKRRSKKKILHGTRLHSSEDSGEIVNFETSTVSTSDASKLSANSTISKVNMTCASADVLPEADLLPSLGSLVSEKVDINSDANRPSFSNRKKEQSSLNTLSASLLLSDDVSTGCPGHGERVVNVAKEADCTSILGTDEVAVHAGGSCLANENIGLGDGFGFNLHADSVDLHVQNLENLLDSKDLLNTLGAIRVDSINEQPLQDGLVLKNAFGEGPSKCMTTVEDITGLSRHHEIKIPNVQEDKHLSEYHKFCAGPLCENTLFKEVEDVIVSDMRSADVNSKKFFPEQVTIPKIGGYCSSNSEETGILSSAAVSDCSNVSLGLATSSTFLSADHKGIAAASNVSVVDTIEQSFNGGANLANKSGYIERASESRNHLKSGSSIDYSPKMKRKRKARGNQMDMSGSNAAEVIVKCSSIDGELASSVKEADLPGAEDNCEVNFRRKRHSGDEDSLLDGVGFFGDDSFPANRKKREGGSPRLNFSSCLVDGSIGDCLANDDLELDQVFLSLAEQDADQREETPSAMHVESTDCSGNFSIPDMDGDLAYDKKFFFLKDGLPFIPNTLSMCVDGSDDFGTQSFDELVASGFDTPSCMSSPEDLLSHTDFNTSKSPSHSEKEVIFEGFQTSNIRPGPVSRYLKTFPRRKSIENATSDHLQTNIKVPPWLSQKTCKVPSSKNQPISAVSKIFSGHPALNCHTTRKLPSTHFAKSRTWHRSKDSSINVAAPTLQSCPLPQNKAPELPRNFQSSYIRKGNSLVRKPLSSSGASAHTLSSSVSQSSPCIDYLKRNQLKVDAPCIPIIEQVFTSEGSESLSLNHTGRWLRSASGHSAESLPVKKFLRNGGPKKTFDALKETGKSSEIPECRTGSGNNSDSQSTLGKENPGKKILYVKRRSNQLVAASDPEDSSSLGLDKTQASLSDGYYKNSKNQLIRVTSESHAKKGDSTETLNSLSFGSQTILPIISGKRQSSKGFANTYKSSKFSMVWNLSGAQLPDKNRKLLGPYKVRPYLFPWRRATYRRSSLSTISQKLLLSRKRGAIYTRSTHGYSLRISKVLSVSGCSLKWSKSIERNSKKANEEATRAVAAAEKRKKEEKGAISVLPKSRNNVSRKSVVSVKLRPGKRIFRIGSERYKMDPSRRSLHRITDEETSSSVVPQAEKNLKRSYVPRRLLIGNDEYVRIGTGNQLVRDPKKRTRLLASEKVRWSLRTARLRLARKRKYCQFFTRFGKCNKSDGKCPYIHDPSKIVVCTKFLNGSCTDSDCKLTHKVIPERMQDCSYFLKGSCSNENCPYRHVTVNPNSSICKRFLRGYCADGNECRKKHTYVCPAFESTGTCPQSFMCKLHHPKKKAERKPTIEQKIVRGRYFDGGFIDVAECSMAINEKITGKGEDDMVYEEGKFPDYISLDISDDGMENA